MRGEEYGNQVVHGPAGRINLPGVFGENQMKLKLILCAFGFHKFFCNVTNQGSYVSFNNDFKCERCQKIQTLIQFENSFVGKCLILKDRVNGIFK
jgi:hypothetical protein